MKKAAVVGMFVALTGLAFGQKPAIVTNNEPGWQKIGEITASFETENESIVVLGADEFTSIRLKVTDAPIHINRVQVFYENGEMEEVELANNLEAGEQTRVIRLKNADQDLKKVAFTYRTLPNRKGDRADVELHGLKTADQSEKTDRNADRYRDDNDNDNEPDENDAKEAAERRQNDTEGALERTEEDIEDASDDANRDVNEAAREAEREADENAEEARESANSVEDQIDEDWGNIKADIKDKIYKDKRGPDNELIYIDSHSKYYYINKKGKKVWITKAEMREKKVD